MRNPPGLTRRSCLSGLTLSLLGGCQVARADGALRIGSSPTGVPFSFVDPWSNAFTGAMIEVADATIARMHMQATYEIIPFSALIPSLLAGKIDLIAAALLRTAARERVAAFSQPLMRYSGGVVLPARSRLAVHRLEDLRGHRVGAQVGTVFIDQLAKAGVREVVTYDGLADILRDLANGRIAAGYGDAPILAYQLRVGPERPLRLAREFAPPARLDLCFVTRVGDPLLDRVNAAITELGPKTLGAVARKWEIS
ncbi:ABC transporter substrate-binding protein [Novosphingobium sp. 1949]|uniref:ABC transporter substrate-binding protein n=1 Tax=Novosphingobium organovorum TaxID=2930092 RepID=A0ABT0BAS6_9SPHN|nr:ABC transporter substrate-binding protein [Novosphingobium organovorum]MCJ2182165.1 ABC transporter substrate-binding protein [Novosphingobium organovorum]